MLLGMLLEMLGLGLVVPALALMVGDATISSSPTVARAREWLGNPSPERALWLGLVVILGIYTAKTAMLLFINWRHHRFVAQLQSDLGRRLFSAYIRQPWTFHLQRSSTTLIRNLENLSSITETVGWTLVLVAESMVLVGVTTLLAWWEPIGAMGMALIIGAATFLLERITRGRLLRWGELQHQHAARRIKFMHEGLHGVKESLIRPHQTGFLDRFTKADAAFSRMTAKKTFVGNLPRLWYEFVAVLGLCSLVGTMAAEGRTTQAMVPVVGLFAAAAFRILPSVNRLAFAMHTMRLNTAAVDTLSDELALERTSLDAVPNAAPLGFHRELVVEGVSYRYPDATADAISCVTLRIARGAAVGLIGPSGAGKSTLIDIILGLLTPSQGRVMIDGIDIATNLASWQQAVGYVPQSIYLADDSIRRNVAFGVADEVIDDDAVHRALKASCLEDFVRSHPQGAETVIGERGVRLSGGQRQRIGIARALYHAPAVLILDEATSSLDGDTERQIMEEINAFHGDNTVIVVAHRASSMAHCDAIYQLEGGALRPATEAAAAVRG